MSLLTLVVLHTLQVDVGPVMGYVQRTLLTVSWAVGPLWLHLMPSSLASVLVGGEGGGGGGI